MAPQDYFKNGCQSLGRPQEKNYDAAGTIPRINHVTATINYKDLLTIGNYLLFVTGMLPVFGTLLKRYVDETVRWT